MPLVPPYIDALSPYEAGRRTEDVQQAYGLERVIKLASNENPLGASPLAMEALHNAVDDLAHLPERRARSPKSPSGDGMRQRLKTSWSGADPTRSWRTSSAHSYAMKTRS